MAAPKSPIPTVPIARLTPDPDNARTHSLDQIGELADMIRAYGWTMPIAYDDVIRAGNARFEAAKLIYAAGERIYLAPGKDAGGFLIPEGHIPGLDCSGWTEAQRRAYALADNKSALNAGWDEAKLLAELQALAAMDIGLPTGFSTAETEGLLASLNAQLDQGGGPGGAKLGGLTGEFLVAPFSVLNAREGWWQDRKRQWIALGIQSEVGRGENLLRMSDTILEPDPAKRAAAKAGGLNFNTQGWVKDKIAEGDIAGGMSSNQSGTSIFDPVLCELAYRWWSPVGGLVLDPFAGGSVRGIVAGKLGRRYLGIDLRAEQVEANEAQAAAIIHTDEPTPEWRCGDSRDLLSWRDGDPEIGADFVFSCPPYGDLEVYSDDPHDLSTMDHGDFIAAYRTIIDRAVASLKPDRFACFVIGDFRDRLGFYRNFVSDTIAAFEAAGARLYNEAILVTSAGSLPIRAAKQFRTTRKLGKTHQNILVFVKGDPKRATEACGPVDVSAALTMFGEGDPGDEPSSSGELGDDQIKISAAMARLEFIECGPACIAAGCAGNCCDAPSRPTGCMITINPDEQARIEALGGVVVDGLLQPRPGERGCPFKAEGLCGLHMSGEKPWGCVASPFTLNPKGTLIVRNRYRLLPCYRNEGPKAPAYRTFRSSLAIIFGEEETDRITAHLDAGGGDLIASVDPAIKAKLFANDDIKRAAKAAGGEV